MFRLGGGVATVSNDFELFRSAAADLGLSLNTNKCEVICPESDSVPDTFRGFRRVRVGDCELLGAPLLGGDGLAAALERRCSELA